MIQLFLGLSMTLVVHALPSDTLEYAQIFSPEHTIDMGSTTQSIEDSLQKQTNVPVLDVGALVFYSGNILIDLFLNFFFAIPEAISILVNAFFMVAPVEAFIATQIKLFIFAIITIIYLFVMFQFIAGIRSGAVS